MKQFIGTCVENPFNDIGMLTGIMENRSKLISKRSFLRQCDIPQELLAEIQKYPDDYEFYKSSVPFSK